MGADIVNPLERLFITLRRSDNHQNGEQKQTENWANIVYFSEAPRSTYKEIREARPDQAMARKAMMDFIEAAKLKNCVVQEGYIQSLGMKKQ